MMLIKRRCGMVFGNNRALLYLPGCVLLVACVLLTSCAEYEVDCRDECDSRLDACHAFCTTRPDTLKKLQCWLICNESFEPCYDNCEQLKKLEAASR